MWVSLSSIFLNFGLNYMLAKPYGHFGLAMTTSLTLSVNVLLLASGLRSEQMTWDKKQLLKSAAFLLLGIFIYFSLDRLVTAVFDFHSLRLFDSRKLNEFFRLSLQSALVLIIFSGLGCIRLGWGVENVKRRLQRR